MRRAWPPPTPVVPEECRELEKKLRHLKAAIAVNNKAVADDIADGMKELVAVNYAEHKRLVKEEADVERSLDQCVKQHVRDFSQPSSTEFLITFETTTEWGKLLEVLVDDKVHATLESFGGRLSVEMAADLIPRTKLLFSKPMMLGFYSQRYLVVTLGEEWVDDVERGPMKLPGVRAGEELHFRWVKDNG